MGQLTLEVQGARKLSRALMRSAAATEPELRAAVRQTGRRSITIFRRVAPKRTGRLHQGISFRMAGSGGVVTAFAQNRDTGYDYVGVTRWGHRVRRIKPKSAQALAFQIGGRTIIRKSVKGYKPKGGDWAERALPAIALYSRGALKQAGTRILQEV